MRKSYVTAPPSLHPNNYCLFVRREFYYIQMEKYARQHLSEGLKNADDIVVTFESEIIRALNLHYNRNNHLEVSLYVEPAGS